MIPEIVATLASGMFFGAASYINLVEQPARISCGVPLAVAEWRPSYKRATLMQVPLAVIGSLAALVSWRIDGDLACRRTTSPAQHPVYPCCDVADQ